MGGIPKVVILVVMESIINNLLFNTLRNYYHFTPTCIYLILRQILSTPQFFANPLVFYVKYGVLEVTPFVTI